MEVNWILTRQLAFDGMEGLNPHPGSKIFRKGDNKELTVMSFKFYDYEKKRWMIRVSGRSRPIELEKLTLSKRTEYD